MSDKRTVTIEFEDLLDVVNCAETYGYDRAVLLDAIAAWCDRRVSDAEIDTYAACFLTMKGYGVEDQRAAQVQLRAWRDRYCGPPDARHGS